MLVVLWAISGLSIFSPLLPPRLLDALHVQVQLRHIETKLLDDLLTNVHLRNAMQQERSALVRKKLAVEHEAEASVIANLLVLVVCRANKEEVDDLGVLVDGIDGAGFGLEDSARTVAHGGRQDHLKVLGDSEAQEANLRIHQGCQIRHDVLDGRAVLDDLLHGLMAKILQQLVSAGDQLRQSVLLEVPDSIAAA